MLREAVFQLQSARIGPSSKTDVLQSLIRSHLSLAKVPSFTGQVLYHLQTQRGFLTELCFPIGHRAHRIGNGTCARELFLLE
jgi:hypothetical protein